jgi:hypothetical protein
MLVAWKQSNNVIFSSLQDTRPLSHALGPVFAGQCMNAWMLNCPLILSFLYFLSYSIKLLIEGAVHHEGPQVLGTCHLDAGGAPHISGNEIADTLILCGT